MNAIIKALRDRKRALKMRVRWIAKRAALDVFLAAQILRGKSQPTDEQVRKIAETLGIRVEGDRLVEVKSIELIRREVAIEKARYLAKALQGTMLLEAQGIDSDTLGGIIQDNTQFLLAHPRQLWG